MRWKSILVVVLIMLAGCGGGTSASPDSTTSLTSAETTASGTTTAPEPTQTQTPTTTTSSSTTTVETTIPTTAAPPANPWRTEKIVVGIEYYNESQPVPTLYRNAVRNATTYWNHAYTEYSDFEDVEFAFRVNASSPDVTVSVVEDLTYCGGTIDESYVGCAPTYDDDDDVLGSSEVEIEAGFTPSSTNQTMRHEFGHLLGLDHGMEPMPLMAAESETVKQDVPDAVNRSYPWLSKNLTVAITGSPSDEQRHQIIEALGYFERGADGLLTETKPTFEIIENKSQADVVIEASRNKWACGQEYAGGSCGDYLGYDEDADPALEYYSDIHVTLASTDDDTTAWHAAYWIALGMGARGDEIPDPLDNENDNPRSDWWT